MRASIACLLLLACGPAAEEATSESEVQPSPSDRVIIWQQNIEGMKAGAVRAHFLTDAMQAFPFAPDIVIMEEAWQRVLCGDYTDPAAETDPTLYNFRDSLRDQNGLSYTCTGGSKPRLGSVLYRLGVTLWGGIGNVGHRRPFSNTLGAHSRTGVTVVWDRRRFVFEDDFVWNDSMVPGCSTELQSYQRVAVLLRDTRRTTTTDDDRLIALATIHYGSACKSSNDRWIAEEMVLRWSTFEGRPLSLRVIAGDFNTRVDESSATYADRRREERPSLWYSRYTTTNSWLGGHFTDPIVVRHPSGTADTAELCAEWTYPNVSRCVPETRCSDRCTGFGIDGQLDRLDYTFVATGSGPLPRTRIIAAQTDENSAIYSDHKAVRISISH